RDVRPYPVAPPGDDDDPEANTATGAGAMWRRRERKQQREPERESVESPVGDECEAFLAGQLALYLRDRGRPVLPVGWLNHVVHASPDELGSPARGCR